MVMLPRPPKAADSALRLSIEDLAAIATAVRATMCIPVERRLWGIAEIADYSNYSASTVQQHIVCLPTFPKRIKFDAKAQPRWPAGEVMDWFESRCG